MDSLNHVCQESVEFFKKKAVKSRDKLIDLLIYLLIYRLIEGGMD